MKKVYFIFSMLLLTCSGANLQAQSLGNIISNVASSVDKSGTLGSVVNALVGEDIEGEWNFEGVAVELEADDIVSSAAGVALAEQIEKKVDDLCAKMHIDLSSLQFIFNEDLTFTSRISKRNFSGTYVLDSETNEITLDYGVYNNAIKIGTLNSYASLSKGTLCLLFPGNQLLKLMKAIPELSKNENLAVFGTVVNQYNGIKIGIELKKKATATTTTSKPTAAESVTKSLGKWF